MHHDEHNGQFVGDGKSTGNNVSKGADYSEKTPKWVDKILTKSKKKSIVKRRGKGIVLSRKEFAITHHAFATYAPKHEVWRKEVDSNWYTGNKRDDDTWDFVVKRPIRAKRRS